MVEESLSVNTRVFPFSVSFYRPANSEICEIPDGAFSRDRHKKLEISSVYNDNAVGRIVVEVKEGSNPPTYRRFAGTAFVVAKKPVRSLPCYFCDQIAVILLFIIIVIGLFVVAVDANTCLQPHTLILQTAGHNVRPRGLTPSSIYFSQNWIISGLCVNSSSPHILTLKLFSIDFKPANYETCDLLEHGNPIGNDADPISNIELTPSNDWAFCEVDVPPHWYQKAKVLLPVIPESGAIGVIGFPGKAKIEKVFRQHPYASKYLQDTVDQQWLYDLFANVRV